MILRLIKLSETSQNSFKKISALKNRNRNYPEFKLSRKWKNERNIDKEPRATSSNKHLFKVKQRNNREKGRDNFQRDNDTEFSRFYEKHKAQCITNRIN